jgi:hypothetical protein
VKQITLAAPSCGVCQSVTAIAKSFRHHAIYFAVRVRHVSRCTLAAVLPHKRAIAHRDRAVLKGFPRTVTQPMNSPATAPFRALLSHRRAQVSTEARRTEDFHVLDASRYDTNPLEARSLTRRQMTQQVRIKGCVHGVDCVWLRSFLTTAAQQLADLPADCSSPRSGSSDLPY